MYEVNYDNKRECAWCNECNIVQESYNKGRIDMKNEIEEHSVFYSNRPIEDIVLEARADAIGEVFKGIYEHFEKHHIEVFGKDEVLDELILFLDEFYVYTKIKEQLKEQK